MRHYNAVVTAGGTSEPIDDVRVLTNISTGRFGFEIARLLAESGTETTLLCPKSSVDRLGTPDGVSVQHFSTADSLRELLLDRPRPDLIVQAAAVADYKPVRHEGKISSSSERLQIELLRNPKIIQELRPHFGVETMIVGFKLLSGVSEEELIAVAAKLLKTSRLNLVVANDLKNLKDGRHPIRVVTAEGGVLPIEGLRQDVSERLVELIVKRLKVNWYRSYSVEKDFSQEAETKLFGEVLGLVKSMNLLTDQSGNISASLRRGKITVSPRQVDKSALSIDSAIPAEIIHGNRTISYNGKNKPSIDTGVSSRIYEAMPNINALMHFHNGWGRAEVATSFPYPCGTVEEAKEILSAGIDKTSNSFSAELVDHGFLIGMNHDELNRLKDEWRAAIDEFIAHVAEVNSEYELRPELLKPIFDGKSVVGVIYDDPEGIAVYLNEGHRKTGLGGALVSQIIKRQKVVRTVDDCGVREYYKLRGFTESFDDNYYYLSPPLIKV